MAIAQKRIDDTQPIPKLWQMSEEKSANLMLIVKNQPRFMLERMDGFDKNVSQTTLDAVNDVVRLTATMRTTYWTQLSEDTKAEVTKTWNLVSQYMDDFIETRELKAKTVQMNTRDFEFLGPVLLRAVDSAQESGAPLEKQVAIIRDALHSEGHLQRLDEILHRQTDRILAELLTMHDFVKTNILYRQADLSRDTPKAPDVKADDPTVQFKVAELNGHTGNGSSTEPAVQPPAVETDKTSKTQDMKGVARDKFDATKGQLSPARSFSKSKLSSTKTASSRKMNAIKDGAISKFEALGRASKQGFNSIRTTSSKLALKAADKSRLTSFVTQEKLNAMAYSFAKLASATAKSAGRIRKRHLKIRSDINS